jgi:glutamate N-acetyltransferase/amino-acid N-acetyltransferase
MHIPNGFTLAAVAAGIKKKGLDLGLIVSEPAAAAAAVFTRNAFPAAPVVLSRQNLRRSNHRVRGVLVNSGNANAANGTEGIAAARMCVDTVAGSIGCAPEEVFVSSTGVIGRPLPAQQICSVIPELAAALNNNDADSFARAIMTTDTFPKIASAKVGDARIVGFAKGAGMIHPNMATMLSFIISDAQIDPSMLDSALKDAVDRSFHCISVDGDTSTNDTVLVLANGASGFAPPEVMFREALTAVTQDLAKSIVRDGEGASKFIEIIIEDAPSDDAARHIGRTIARSPLVKTAIYGCDPNWGRLIAAIGNAEVPLATDQIELFIDDIPLIGGDLKLASERMNRKEVHIRASLHSGMGKAVVWTCDFTEEYIRINADYTT